LTLYGPRGDVISSQNFKRAPAPILGEKFGNWAGPVNFINLPGAGIIQFNLNSLTLADFRSMRDHYQVNASLSVLSFMLHQTDYHIECENTKQRDFYEEVLAGVWTRLVRALSQAFWAGYSPNILQWENDTEGRRVILAKIKDLHPEECTVNWEEVEGYRSVSGPGRIKPKIKIYDGIRQVGWPDAIPVDNTLWYPLLMENGDYYGRRLLRAAFQPYFFSILVHLFANRYYERFGEPTPVGRAPFEEEVDLEGEKVRGNVYMGQVIQQLRNRSVVVLPNEKTPVGSETQPDYDYQLEYLESQMRGADFERYLTRLDEEISLGLFTPLLLMRTADVGSYNLGVGHTQVYLWMLNALTGDWKEYIDKYILDRLRGYNFGMNAPKAEIIFRRLGKENADLVRLIVQEMMKKGTIKTDVRQLGELAGLTFEEVEAITTDDPSDDDPDDRKDRVRDDRGGPRGTDEPRATSREISARVALQVSKAFKSKTFGTSFAPSFGYRRRFAESLRVEGYRDPEKTAADFYSRLERWCEDVTELGMSEFSEPEQFMSLFDRVLENELVELADGK